MKLFFDARYIRTDFHDGISRYSTELGKALAKLTPVTFIISDKAQLDKLPAGSAHVFAPAPSPKTEALMARIINKYHPDVVFSPLQTFGSAGRKFKLILTSHDMIYYHHRTPPHGLSRSIKFGWFLYHLTYAPQRLQLNNADMVATVSHTSQRDFEAAKLTKRPIIVIPNAPQKLEMYIDKVDATKTPKNLIYMGSFMPYKNVETLIKAMKYLPNHHLHLMSKIGPARRKQLEKLIPKNSVVIFHGGVSDEEYAHVLADRSILVTASLDEGYGLPIAEAMALGVPAVVSDIAIFHEVAGSGALYFDPTDPREFAQKVEELSDKTRRLKLIENGKKHAGSFSWQASAQALLNAINSLV